MGSLDKRSRVSIFGQKIKAKVISVPSAATPAQIETALNAQLNNGWSIAGTLILGANNYIILQKELE